MPHLILLVENTDPLADQVRQHRARRRDYRREEPMEVLLDRSSLAIQEQLYLVVGLTSEAIEKQHPHLAQHLAWCHACQELLADLLDMDEIEKTPIDEVAEDAAHLQPFLERTAGKGLVRAYYSVQGTPATSEVFLRRFNLELAGGCPLVACFGAVGFVAISSDMVIIQIPFVSC